MTLAFKIGGLFLKKKNRKIFLKNYKLNRRAAQILWKKPNLTRIFNSNLSILRENIKIFRDYKTAGGNNLKVSYQIKLFNLITSRKIN